MDNPKLSFHEQSAIARRAISPTLFLDKNRQATSTMQRQRLWKFIYLGGAILSVWTGFSSLAPRRTAETNADWIFVTISFVITCFFPLGAMAYSRSNGIETFRRPSLDRQPLGWWRDPLQPLRVSVVSLSLFMIGACFALFRTDHKGVMVFWFYAALTVGLFIGERIVYQVYKKRIT